MDWFNIVEIVSAILAAFTGAYVGVKKTKPASRKR